MGMEVRDVNGVVFIFQLFHEVDVYRVFQMAPWTFDNQVLILNRFGDDVSPSDVPLFHIPLWI